MKTNQEAAMQGMIRKEDAKHVIAKIVRNRPLWNCRNWTSAESIEPKKTRKSREGIKELKIHAGGLPILDI